jgi:hypothetical protein
VESLILLGLLFDKVRFNKYITPKLIIYDYVSWNFGMICFDGSGAAACYHKL